MARVVSHGAGRLLYRLSEARGAPHAPPGLMRVSGRQRLLPSILTPAGMVKLGQSTITLGALALFADRLQENRGTTHF